MTIAESGDCVRGRWIFTSARSLVDAIGGAGERVQIGVDLRPGKAGSGVRVRELAGPTKRAKCRKGGARILVEEGLRDTSRPMAIEKMNDEHSMTASKINKPVEEPPEVHLCYLCGGKDGVMKTDCYDEFGVLWICSCCWEKKQAGQKGKAGKLQDEPNDPSRAEVKRKAAQ